MVVVSAQTNGFLPGIEMILKGFGLFDFDTCQFKALDEVPRQFTTGTGNSLIFFAIGQHHPFNPE